MRVRKPSPLAAALCAVAVACALTPAWGAGDPKASRFYEDALNRFEQRDVAGAIVQLKNALQIDRDMLPAHVLLGRALLANNEYAAAEASFDEALRLGVNRAEVVVPLAQAALALGKQDQVLEQPRFAVNGLPAGVQAQLLRLRAGAQSDRGDAREALRSIELARTLDPQAAETWLAEVPIRIRAHQLAEADAAVDKALALAPSSADAWYQRGAVALVRGDTKTALAAQDRALGLRAGHVEARIARAGIYLDQGRNEDARRDLAELRRSAPAEPRVAWLRALLAERDGNAAESRAAMTEITTQLDPIPIDALRYRPQVLLLAGLAHFGLGQPQKAKPYLEMAQRNQAGGGVGKLLAQVYLAENNQERAVEALEQHLKTAPRDAQAVAMLAQAHMALGRPARAARLVSDALTAQDVPLLHASLGQALLASGRPAEARAELETAYRKDPTLVQAGSALVGLYLQDRETARAVAVAEELVKRRPADIALLLQLGGARARAGDAAGARKAFEQALAADDRQIGPRIGLARLEAAAGKPDAAAARLREALAIDDKNVEANGEMGALAEQRGQTADAQRWLEKAVDFARPGDLRPLIALVDFHLRGGRAPAALEAARRLAAKAPEDVPALVTVARAYLAADNVDAARTTLTNATRVANFDAPLQVQIALLQLAARNLSGAAYSLEKALSSDPSFLPAQALMGDVEIRQGEFAKAEQRARQLTARWPKSAVGWSLLGALAAERNQGPAAVDAFRHAYQLEPSTDSVLRLVRTQALADLPGALQVADGWLRKNPQDRLVRLAVGDAQARAGQYAAARVSYEATLKQSPKDPEALNNLAGVLIALNDPGALKAAEQALALQPNNPNVIDTAGWAAFRAGQKDRALQLLRDARLRAPDLPEIRYHLAAALADAGRRNEARDELEAALKGNRAFQSRKEAAALLASLR